MLLGCDSTGIRKETKVIRIPLATITLLGIVLAASSVGLAIFKSTGDNWTSFYAAVILAAVVSYQTGRLTRKGIYVR